MQFWRENVDKIIDFQNKKLLVWNGTISQEEMQRQVEKLYGVFHEKRKKREFLNDDIDDMKELQKLEKTLKLKQ